MNPKNWYDFIAIIYDGFTFWFYRKMRKDLIENLHIRPGDRILIIACGTGQSFDLLEKKTGKQREIIGIDYSEGMLRKARKRMEKHHWTNIKLIKADVRDLSRDFFIQRDINPEFDIVLAELAFSVIPSWKKVMQTSLQLLKQGGRIGILDWYRPKNDLLTRIVNFLAQAEITRNIPQYAGQLMPDFKIIKTYFYGNIFIGTGTNKAKSPQ